MLEMGEAFLGRTSEYLNPLLVKEARQALKSNQFATTFLLMMILAWGWSFLGVSLSEFPLALGPDGRGMLYGYFLILVIAMFVIVPFSAFRSLASEREDGTFELISITTLSARQIVFGKLGSAVVQMIVYLSAIAPCIAFTSLLRGVDIYLISFLLTITFVVSIAFSAFGLMFATVTKARHWQAAISVILILALGFVTLIWLGMTFGMFIEGNQISLDTETFWTAILNVSTVAISTTALCSFAAASQLSFASDNRATALRLVMVTQNILGIGWFFYYFLVSQDWEMLDAMVCVMSLYWVVAGALMSAESPQLSPRVLRELPQSLVGRALFCWFNPGSGTGYVFAMSNVLIVVLLPLAAIVVSMFPGMRQFGFPVSSPNSNERILTCALAISYVAAYLGVGRIIFVLMRQFMFVSLPLAFVVHMALHIVGNMVPFMLYMSLDRYQTGYLSILGPSWLMTIAAALDGKVNAGDPAVPLVLLTGAIIFLINLLMAAVEVSRDRLVVPERVQADDLELHPERAPKLQKSPWD